jgi:HEAT repeat protein
MLMIGATSIAGVGCANDAPGQAGAMGSGGRPAEWGTKERLAGREQHSMPKLNIPDEVNAEEIPELRRGALRLLRQAADSTNALLRANATEAMQAAGRDEAESVVRLGLADENRGVRFVAAMTVSELGIEEMAPLVDPLLDDPSNSVRAAAILALHRAGREVDPSPLAMMLESDDAELRGNAALVLGELGNPSAIPMLRSALRDPLDMTSVTRQRIVELQIAEAMVKLGRTSELEVIHAAMFSPAEQAELVALACQIMGRLGDSTYAAAMENKAVTTGRQEQPAEVRLAAATALAHLDPSRAPISVPLQFVGHDRYELRAYAAASLGWFRDPAALGALRALLADENPVVQVAAAGSILRITGGAG